MINVLSLFDGLSGAKIALENLGIKNNYYASEVDKYAIQISQKNYPDIIQIGDVKEITKDMFPNKIDLLVAGFPCTDCSIAKRNRENLQGKQSSLFYEALRLLNEIKPRFFLIENVSSMKASVKQEISNLLGVQPILINSALVTAQQRKRLYWTNISGIQQPEDKHIYLKDILEFGYTEKEKSYCVVASYNHSAPYDYFINKSRQYIFNKPVRVGIIGKGGQGDRIYSIDGKSICLSANGGGRSAKTGLYLFPACLTERRTEEAKQIRKEYREKYGKDWSPRREKELVSRMDRKSNCLTTGITKEHFILFLEEIKPYIRKLMPIECERLQGVNDNYTEGVSNTQRYKMLGNGFTVPVIEHILSYVNWSEL